MAAKRITRFKSITPNGGVMEGVIWPVPISALPTAQGFQCRTVYAMDSACIAGVDKGRGQEGRVIWMGKRGLPY